MPIVLPRLPRGPSNVSMISMRRPFCCGAGRRPVHPLWAGAGAPSTPRAAGRSARSLWPRARGARGPPWRRSRARPTRPRGRSRSGAPRDRRVRAWTGSWARGRGDRARRRRMSSLARGQGRGREHQFCAPRPRCHACARPRSRCRRSPRTCPASGMAARVTSPRHGVPLLGRSSDRAVPLRSAGVGAPFVAVVDRTDVRWVPERRPVPRSEWSGRRDRMPLGRIGSRAGRVTGQER